MFIQFCLINFTKIEKNLNKLRCSPNWSKKYRRVAEHHEKVRKLHLNFINYILILGKGVFSWSNGSRYEGEFSHNNINGTGMYKWGDER